jgi:hypothetical protein
MGFKLTTLVVIGTNCTGSCKSCNYDTIMIMLAPMFHHKLTNQHNNPNLYLEQTDMKVRSYNSIAFNLWTQVVGPYVPNERQGQTPIVFTFI